MTYAAPRTYPAHAKINLFLDVIGRRQDGYHTISGVMQSVSLADEVTLTLIPSEADAIRLTCSDPSLPTDRGNLAYRAAEIFLSRLRADGCREPAFLAKIHIEKRIPYPAGLAGGSADAAAVLRGLNHLTDEPYNQTVLEAMGGRLGADVPFCIRGGTCITEGVGDKLTPCAPLPNCDIVIACAGEGISTPDAYHALDAAYGNFEKDAYCPRRDDLTGLLYALEHGDLPGVGAHGFNLFESVVLPRHAQAAALRNTLEAAGACGVRMSGSGPSIFALFHPGTADDACKVLRTQGIPAWVCHPVG